MLGKTELEASLRKIQNQIKEAEKKEKAANKDVKELDSEIPAIKQIRDNEETRVSSILKTMSSDLAGVSFADKFTRMFEEEVRGVLQGGKVRSALTDMSSIIGSTTKQRKESDQLAWKKKKEKQGLLAKAEEIKRKLRVLAEAGDQQ